LIYTATDDKKSNADISTSTGILGTIGTEGHAGGSLHGGEPDNLPDFSKRVVGTIKTVYYVLTGKGCRDT